MSGSGNVRVATTGAPRPSVGSAGIPSGSGMAAARRRARTARGHACGWWSGTADTRPGDRRPSPLRTPRPGGEFTPMAEPLLCPPLLHSAAIAAGDLPPGGHGPAVVARSFDQLGRELRAVVAGRRDVPVLWGFVIVQPVQAVAATLSTASTVPTRRLSLLRARSPSSRGAARFRGAMPCPASCRGIDPDLSGVSSLARVPVERGARYAKHRLDGSAGCYVWVDV